MEFREWLGAQEALFNEDYRTAVEKFARESPGMDRAAIQRYVDEFKKIVSKKYKQIFDDIHGVAVPRDKRTNIDAYGRFRDLELVVDHVRGQVDVHGRVNFKDVEVDAKPVFENDTMTIYHADSPRACVKYKGNVPYSWCVARNDSGNLYHAYRFKQNEPSFYFVKNKQRTQEEFKLLNMVKTAFDGKFKDPYHFFVVQVVKGAKPDEHEAKQYIVTSANNDRDAPMSWKDLLEIEPGLNGLEGVFKNFPLTPEERQDHREFSGGVGDQTFAALPYERKNRYMDIYVRLNRGLTDGQFASLPEDLKNKYIGFGVGLTDAQYESIKGTRLEKRYRAVTIEKIKALSEREDHPLMLARSERSILLDNPGLVDLSNITTQNIIALLGGMAKPKKTRVWYDDDGYGHEEEDEEEEEEDEYEEISADRHRPPGQRKEDQRMAEIIISSKKDLGRNDVVALIMHSPDPKKTIGLLGEKLNLLDKNTIRALQKYSSKAHSEYIGSLSDALFDGHQNLDRESLHHILATTKDRERVVQRMLGLQEPLGSVAFDLVQVSKDKEKTLDTLLSKKDAFVGVYPGWIGEFYFGKHDGDFFNSLRGERRKRLAERLAEDNKQSILAWDKKRIIGHNPVMTLMLMTPDKKRILEILGEEALDRMTESDINALLTLSTPEEADKFAELHGNLSHKNTMSLLQATRDKIKVLDGLGQKGIDEMSASDIAMLMDSKKMDDRSKGLVANEIARRRSKFAFSGTEYFTYAHKIIERAADRLRAAKEIVSKMPFRDSAGDFWYFFKDLKMGEDEMQELTEFTVKNIELHDGDLLSVLAFAPDKQKAIYAAGEERFRKAVKSRQWHSGNYPPLKDMAEKYS